MGCSILDGKTFSAKIEEEIKLEVSVLKDSGVIPFLCVILVGNNQASVSYVNMKVKACARVGIKCDLIKLDSSINEYVLLDIICKLNKDVSVNGILVQLPLPDHINKDRILESIDINKDVDGFHPYNIGSLYANIQGRLPPATPFGVMLLLEEYNICVEGKDVVIVGASNIVGKPLASMMLNAGASVSICHALTKDITKYTLGADIVCVGVGKVNLLDSTMIKDGAIIIDIGINKLPNGKIVGDVNFDDVINKTSFVTPVPGGVGPMTISALLLNTMQAVQLQKKA